MPLFESACGDQECSRFAKVEEHFYPHSDSPMQACEACGKTEKMLISGFRITWAKPIGEYGDPSKEFYHQGLKGHWVTRKNSSRRPDGRPEREFIETVQQQRRYCKEEGLIPPDEVGPAHFQSDGKSVICNGLPGQWV